MAEKIGFIGTGLMGAPMAENVRKAGYELAVYNRTASKTAPLAEAGATVARTPSEAASGASAVILMVTGPEAVDTVVDGDQGVAAAAERPRTVINMSTVPPAYSRQLDERLRTAGIDFVEAPVAGSRKPAAEGRLVILAGGSPERVSALEPLLSCMGNKVVHCGAIGMGTGMKMTVNLLLAIMMEGICETVHFGRRCGLSPDFILDTLLAGPLGSAFYGLKAEMIKSGEYPVEFPLKHMLKDLRFVLRTAEEGKAAVPAARNLAALFEAGVDQGLADLDMAAIKRVLEAMSG